MSLRRMIEAVRAFNEAQRPADTSVEAAPGIVSERRWVPLDAVGLCVPSGRVPLPSSLVMTAVPALVAGVRRLVVVTPNPAEATLVVARELGIDEVYAVGGAQAVAALAYGTDTIEPVDAIVGPGSPYVTAAKLLVSSRVRIDLPAGPSEVVVIADATADAAPGRRGPARAGRARLRQRGDPLHGRRRRSPARSPASSTVTQTSAWSRSSRSTSAVARAEEYAPEHLELHVADPDALVPRIRNAGSVFVGCSSVVGDYAAGATHVLPTGGLARSTGGLGVEAFLKPVQVVTATPEGARRAAEVIVPLARVEGPSRCTRRQRHERGAGDRPARRARLRALRLGRRRSTRSPSGTACRGRPS